VGLCCPSALGLGRAGRAETGHSWNHTVTICYGRHVVRCLQVTDTNYSDLPLPFGERLPRRAAGPWTSPSSDPAAAYFGISIRRAHGLHTFISARSAATSQTVNGPIGTGGFEG
jgi:hypothetical protein